MEDILEEVKSLKEDGYQEITLLGQNVNAYGKDLHADYDFATLLKMISTVLTLKTGPSLFLVFYMFYGMSSSKSQF